MKIAIVSDTHDQLEKVEILLAAIKEHNCEAIIHCGDWCSPFVVEEFCKLGLPIFTSMGNNDGDRGMIRSKLQHADLKYELDEEILEITLDDKKFGINHYPDVADVLINSHQYDVVCFGHNHARQIDRLGNAWLINPGALIRNQAEGWGFAIYDSQKNDTKFVTL